MNYRQVPRKIAARFSTFLYKLWGKDSITGAKIFPREDLKEIGSDYGGWVVPTRRLGPDSICYCVGCGEDITFDLGLIDRFGCHVYGLDPTPRAMVHVKKVAAGNPKYHFFDIGLWDKEDMLNFFAPKNPDHVSHSLLNLQKTENYISVHVKRLSSFMKELGHQKIDLLKIDIEGAEYKVIDSILEDDLDVGVLCVEYDECFNPLDADYRNRILDSVNNLTKNGYSLVCSQGNGNYTFVKNA